MLATPLTLFHCYAFRVCSLPPRRFQFQSAVPHPPVADRFSKLRFHDLAPFRGIVRGIRSRLRRLATAVGTGGWTTRQTPERPKRPSRPPSDVLSTRSNPRQPASPSKDESAGPQAKRDGVMTVAPPAPEMSDMSGMSGMSGMSTRPSTLPAEGGAR